MQAFKYNTFLKCIGLTQILQTFLKHLSNSLFIKK